MFSLVHTTLLSQRLRTEETLEERQGGGGLEGGHHVAGEADRGEAEVLRAGGASGSEAVGRSQAAGMRIAHGSRVHAARGLRCGGGVRARRTLSGAPATVYVVT